MRAATGGLSSAEDAWLEKRRSNVVLGLQSYLHQTGIEEFDVEKYIEAIGCKKSDVPVNGMTLSGGGDRAKLAGLGMYRAIDGRDDAAVKAGTGGLLQAMTCTVGCELSTPLSPPVKTSQSMLNHAVSGGSQTVTGLAINGFPPALQLIEGNQFNFTSNTDAVQGIIGKADFGYDLK